MQANALTVYMQHMNDVAHFIYDAQLLREIRGTLMRADVKDAITQKFGDKIWNDVYQVDGQVIAQVCQRQGRVARLDGLPD